MIKMNGMKQYIVVTVAILLGLGIFYDVVSIQDAQNVIVASEGLQGQIEQVADPEATLIEKAVGIALMVSAAYKLTERSAMKKQELAIKELSDTLKASQKEN